MNCISREYMFLSKLVCYPHVFALKLSLDFTLLFGVL